MDELGKRPEEWAVDLEPAYDDTVEALGSALQLKDAETEAHCQHVTAFTISIAKAVPVPLGYLPILARAAFLHDIGTFLTPSCASLARSTKTKGRSCAPIAKSASTS